MTEREKIVKIIAPYVAAYSEDEAIADALIAAGLRFTFTSNFANDTQKAYKEGYLKGKEESEAEIELAKAFHDEKCAEWELACYKLQKAERRAEVAERALRNITERASCNICDNFSCRYYEGIYYDYNAEECIKWWLAQAEKELAEERENAESRRKDN